MTSPNNDRITANDGEWRQHRDKFFKRVTSKLRRQHGKELVDEEVDDSIFEVTDEDVEYYKRLIQEKNNETKTA